MIQNRLEVLRVCINYTAAIMEKEPSNAAVRGTYRSPRGKHKKKSTFKFNCLTLSVKRRAHPTLPFPTPCGALVRAVEGSTRTRFDRR